MGCFPSSQQANPEYFYQRAEDVFGIPEVAGKWLQEPNLATDGQPPIVLLGSDGGYARVKTLLDRIDYGVLA